MVHAGKPTLWAPDPRMEGSEDTAQKRLQKTLRNTLQSLDSIPEVTGSHGRDSRERVAWSDP